MRPIEQAATRAMLDVGRAMVLPIVQGDEVQIWVRELRDLVPHVPDGYLPTLPIRIAAVALIEAKTGRELSRAMDLMQRELFLHARLSAGSRLEAFRNLVEQNPEVVE